MAKIQNPFIGRASGSAGGMVFQKQFDQNIMRAKPFQGRWSSTPAQIANREILSLITSYAKGLSPSQLQILYPFPILKNSRYSEFMKELQRGRDLLTDPVSINFINLQHVGNGYPSTLFGITAYNNFPSIMVEWEYSLNNQFNDNALVSCLIFNFDKHSILFLESIAQISATYFEAIAPLSWNVNDTIYAFIAPQANLSDKPSSYFQFVSR